MGLGGGTAGHARGGCLPRPRRPPLIAPQGVLHPVPSGARAGRVGGAGEGGRRLRPQLQQRARGHAHAGLLRWLHADVRSVPPGPARATSPDRARSPACSSSIRSSTSSWPGTWTASCRASTARSASRGFCLIRTTGASRPGGPWGARALARSSARTMSRTSRPRSPARSPSTSGAVVRGQPCAAATDPLTAAAAASHLRKVYPRPDLLKGSAEKVALDDVSLQMYEGQIFGLLGHNGARRRPRRRLTGAQALARPRSFLSSRGCSPRPRGPRASSGGTCRRTWPRSAR